MFHILDRESVLEEAEEIHPSLLRYCRNVMVAGAEVYRLWPAAAVVWRP